MQKVIYMKKHEKILSLVEKDFLTLLNLERSIHFALHSNKGRQYQLKVCHAAFKRTCDIMLSRRKQIAKMIGLKLQILENPTRLKKPAQSAIYSTNNPRHRLILRLLYQLKLKPKQVINLRVKDYNSINNIIPVDFINNKQENDYIFLTNRGKKYSIRTIQKIRENAVKNRKV